MEIAVGAGTLSGVDRLKRSWALAGSSWAVIRQDKELLALPVISAVASLICVLPFFASAAMLAMADPVPTFDGRADSFQPGLAGYILMFVGYLLGAYVTIFFQAALIHAANERLAGGAPTLRTALSGALDRAGHILPWALLSATVSVVLRAIQERSGLLGRVVMGFVGLAWTLVTFLVLPILVIEGTGVGEALRRSSAAFRATWGENVAGTAGIGLVSGLVTFGGLIALAPLFVVGAANGIAALTVTAMVLMVLWIAVVAVVSAALSGVYQTALYRYAVLGEEPTGFSAAQISGAFEPKRRGVGRSLFGGS